MKHKFKVAYMNIASVVAELSNAQVLKVGSIIVKGDQILSLGFNGTPSGFDNCCEEHRYLSYDELDSAPHGRTIFKTPDSDSYYYLKTKADVLHSEMNCLMKIAKSTESSDGAVMFTTHSPCIDCAKAIYQAGITHVFYKTQYRDDAGINFLTKSGVSIEHFSEE